MQIESIKRWHWCVVGALVGCTVAAVSIWAGPKEPAGTEVIHRWEFESAFWKGSGKLGALSNLHNVRLHPKTETINGLEEEFISVDATLSVVERGAKMVKQRDIQLRVLPNQKDPAGISASLLGRDAHKMTGEQYLTKLKDVLDKMSEEYIDKEKTKKRYPQLTTLKWQKAYIEDPKLAFAIYGGGGLVIVGIIWPTILNILIGAGFGREVKEKTMDLSKYKGTTPAPAKKSTEMSEDDLDRLAHLEAQLEKSLREGASERQPTEAVAVADAPVKKLIGGGAATEVVPTTDGKSKDFGADQGDYYPTEVHVKKK